MHWSGKIQRDGATDSEDCAAQYAYLTGVATWTGAVPVAHRQWVFGDTGDVVTGAPYSQVVRRGRGVEIPSGEYSVSSLAVALEFALNGRCLRGTLPFSGSGEPSGSEYLVTVTGTRIMIRLGDEVINGLDAFVILPERTLRKVQFVPDFVLEGGPSYNAENPRSLNSLLNNMGLLQVTERYSQGSVDFSGSWRSETAPTEKHMTGAWHNTSDDVFWVTQVDPGTDNHYKAENENNVYVRDLIVSGTSVTSNDYDWATAQILLGVPDLTGIWNRTDSSGNAAGSANFVKTKENVWVHEALNFNAEGNWGPLNVNGIDNRNYQYTNQSGDTRYIRFTGWNEETQTGELIWSHDLGGNNTTLTWNSAQHRYQNADASFTLSPPSNFFFTARYPDLLRYSVKERTSTGFKVAELNSNRVLTYDGTHLSGFANGSTLSPTAAPHLDPSPYLPSFPINVQADYAAEATHELYGVWSGSSGFVSVVKASTGYEVKFMGVGPAGQPDLDSGLGGQRSFCLQLLRMAVPALQCLPDNAHR